MTDEEQIEQYIKERGVTKCPPAYAGPSPQASKWVRLMKDRRHVAGRKRPLHRVLTRTKIASI